MTATKLTPEAIERRRTETLGIALLTLARQAPLIFPPTDEELDAIADACNEILNGIDEWLDDREDARYEPGALLLERTGRVKKRTRKPSKKKARKR